MPMTATDIPLRFIITAQLLAMGTVRAYYGAPRPKERAQSRDAREPLWLTCTIGVFALLNFGAIFAYLVNPSLLRWSAFKASDMTRWLGMALSCLGMAGEIWSAVALGVSYSPMLRVADEHVIVAAGPYRWIRHPLYAFWLPVTVGWGAATGNWLIILSGTALVFVLAVIRVPREEAIMLQGFGELYRNYMARTGRFTPQLRAAQSK